MRTADAAVDSNSAADPARLQVPTTSKRSDSEMAAARPARTMGDSPITNTRILSSDPIIYLCDARVWLADSPWPFADRDAEIRTMSGPENDDRQFPANEASQSTLDVIRIDDGLAADLHDDVPEENAAFFGGAARFDAQDHHARQRDGLQA